MADFVMPSLGADMERGKLVQWLVQPGAVVKPGDVVAVVETHKGAIDVEIFLAGVIGDLVPVGTEVPVGGVLARVAESAAVAKLEVAKLGSDSNSSVANLGSDSNSSLAVAVDRKLESDPHLADPHLRVSPAARRRAQELGVALAGLRGTGPEGSVVVRDVEAAAAGAPAVAAGRGFDPARMRAAIAAAMGRSKREIPHYYLAQEVEVAAAMRWLADYNADRPPAERLLPAVLLLKAAATALRAVPQLNGFYEQDAVRLASAVHVGWAVSLRGGGLVAPAIHDADRKSVAELMAALRDLVQRARTGGLRSSELTDPTVTVTSLGERGADSVAGVIYPPQLAIIGFGRIAQRPWVADGQVVARDTVQVSLAADHRASDGHVGGQLLAAIAQALARPQEL